MNNSNINILEILSIALLLCIVVGAAVFAYWFFKIRKKEVKEKPTETIYNNEFYQESAYKLLPESIVILNSHDKVIYLNPAAEKMLSCRLRSVMGKAHSDVFKLLNHETRRVMQGFLEIQNEQENTKRECLLSTMTKQSYSIDLTLISADFSGEKRKILFLKNITERKALELQLSNIETYDSVTRTFKRKMFDAEVKQLIDSAHKHNSSHVLTYFSIDQFQVLSDAIGYNSGDSLIIAIVEHIKNNINKSIDIVGRLGTSKFAVVFSERKLPQSINAIQTILKEVEDSTFMAGGKQYSLTMSAGFVVIDVNNTSSAKAISEAKIACNLANRRGGNRVFAYKADNSEIQKLEGNSEWAILLKKALQENLFRMHAQPIHPLEVEAFKDPFHHYELLIRLSDEEGKPISPEEFIAAAEYHSMMPSLDRWVITNVFKQLKAIPEQNPLPVFAINLSGQSLNDPQFLDFVQQEIKKSGVHPQMLCFEITEQVAVEDLSSINNFTASLKALGCKFSLDDFGTGVSSFGYLRSLDVDYLKIDGSFVKHIVNDDVAKTMVQSINQVGHTMNLEIIAEYVENNDIIDILREMGVDYGQGYGIGRPGPIEDVIKIHMHPENILLKAVN